MGASMVLESRRVEEANKRALNVLLTGVGGQGIITLATLIARAALSSGTKALVAETHGLSQRGGSVEVHLRLGDVEAPLVPKGEADVILGLEMVEAARKLGHVKDDGLILTSDTIIRPALPSVKTPSKEELVRFMVESGVDVVIVPASRLAADIGGMIFVNTVMLGALAASGVLSGLVDEEMLEWHISRLKRGEDNIKAYRLGFDFYKSLYRDPNANTP